jgi:hypothetical protein
VEVPIADVQIVDADGFPSHDGFADISFLANLLYYFVGEIGWSVPAFRLNVINVEPSSGRWFMIIDWSEAYFSKSAFSKSTLSSEHSPSAFESELLKFHRSIHAS